MPKSEVYNQDCLLGMKEYPDKYFDLAIVDPPYGIDQDGHRENNRSKLAKTRKYHPAVWDMSRPDKEYFNELFRVSRDQIIWGANHFGNLPPASCWVVWDKDNGENHFADCELAWTSFNSAVRRFKFRWQGMLQGDMKNKQERIHPNEKPVQLYKWLLSNYALPNGSNKILDTHLGSGSSRIAAYDMGFDFTGYEIDFEYFQAQEKRFNQFKSQLKIFV